MKLGKINNDTIEIVEAEGEEINNLLKDGYKPICENEQPEGASNYTLTEYRECFVQEWETQDNNEEGNADSGL